MKVPRLTASESLMLDVIRVSAAMVVAFGHLTQGYFSTGWRDDTSFAQAAVVVFFILSGFVIRYVTVGKPATLPVYLSVVVVGILLGHPCNILKLKLRSLLWRDKKPDANTRSTPSERAVTT